MTPKKLSCQSFGTSQSFVTQCLEKADDTDK